MVENRKNDPTFGFLLFLCVTKLLLLLLLLCCSIKPVYGISSSCLGSTADKSNATTEIHPAWVGRSIAGPQLRMVEFSAFLEQQLHPDTDSVIIILLAAGFLLIRLAASTGLLCFSCVLKFRTCSTEGISFAAMHLHSTFCLFFIRTPTLYWTCGFLLLATGL